MAEAIKVAVRVRPFNQRELDLGCTNVVTMEGQNTLIGGKTFTYDFSYASHDPADKNFVGQDQVMSDIGSVILKNSLDGFNGSLFAYGQTGSGKSYSVMGFGDQPGIIPRSVTEIFGHKSEIEAAGDKELRIWISYVEIYNEKLRDLLHAGEEVTELKVMDHPKLGVYIPNLTESACQQPDDVQKLMDFGTKKRVVASTAMNATSSRSHAVFTVRIQNLEGVKPEAGAKDERKALSAKINLIDLAGSERSSKTGAEGATLKEGCAINQSLSALGMVIKELSESMGKKGGAKANVSFRASKLTFLLKDSLAGNSKTYMIAALSPASDNQDETISTLRFAQSVKSIKTVATQNKDKKDELIEHLQDEIKKLTAQASGGLQRTASFDLVACSEDLQEKMRLLEEHTQDYYTQVEHAKEMMQMRADALADGGLSQDEINEAFGVDKVTPYLLNMAHDPMLAGCLLYFFPEGKDTTIGSAKGNTIALSGMGISEELGKITNSGNAEVMLEKLSSDGRLGVNGKLLQQGDRQSLRHGDKIFLGRAHALKMTMPLDPTASSSMDAGSLSLEGLEDEMAALDDSQAWGALQMYLDQVIGQMTAEQARALFDEAKLGCKLSDEFNDISEECRSSECLHCEIDLTSSVPSSVVCRVLQGEAATGDMQEWRQLYLWSVVELQERVERMRDLHTEFVSNKVTEIDVLADPWHQPHPGVIASRLQEYDVLLEECRDEISKLKTSNMHHVGKSIMLWQGTKFGTSLQVVFKAWATDVAAARGSSAKSRTFTSRNTINFAANQRNARASGTAGPRRNSNMAEGTPKSGPSRTTARRSNSSAKLGDSRGSVKKIDDTSAPPGQANPEFNEERGEQGLAADAPPAGDFGLPAPISQSCASEVGNSGEALGDLDSVPSVACFSAPPPNDGVGVAESSIARKASASIVKVEITETAAAGVPLDAFNELQTKNEVLQEDNDSLRKQLTTAWQLCNSLRQQPAPEVQPEARAPVKLNGSYTAVPQSGDSLIKSWQVGPNIGTVRTTTEVLGAPVARYSSAPGSPPPGGPRFQTFTTSPRLYSEPRPDGEMPPQGWPSFVPGSGTGPMIVTRSGSSPNPAWTRSISPGPVFSPTMYPVGMANPQAMIYEQQELLLDMRTSRSAMLRSASPRARSVSSRLPRARSPSGARGCLTTLGQGQGLFFGQPVMATYDAPQLISTIAPGCASEAVLAIPMPITVRPPVTTTIAAPTTTLRSQGVVSPWSERGRVGTITTSGSFDLLGSTVGGF